TTAGLMTLGPSSRLTPTGPVGGFWAGEGSAADATGHSTGATTTGVTFVAGQVGQAFSFNGTNSSVTVPDHPSQRPPQFTVAAWVNPADFAGHTNATVLMKTSASSFSDGYALAFGGISGKISFWLNQSSNAV